MKALLLLLGVLCLSACSTTALQVKDTHHLFRDDLFDVSTERIDAADVLALTPKMQHYLATEIMPKVFTRGPQRALIDALYAKGELKLDYDSTMTRTASQAFEARAGNCLSLVIMTAAFARQMGLPLHYQSVMVDDAWDRSGDLYFFIGHVNLSLGLPARSLRISDGPSWLTVDFLPGQDIGRQRSIVITEARVLAMYMNNRAAEALARGRMADAYAWVREAVRQDPQFISSYNTLGVIYQRQGALPEAEAALRQALAVEPANPHAMGNLVLVLQRQGRDAEAQVLAASLRRLQPVAPFALFQQGMQALKDGDYRRAKSLFEREIARAADYHEFHFWLAIAHLNLGENNAAQKHLKIALDNSTTRDQQGLYAAKLDRLRAQGMQ